jgi:hypothetical protein
MDGCIAEKPKLIIW